MVIVCNRPSGFILPCLQIQPGENVVDDALWAKVEAILNPIWLDALLTSQNGAPPELVISDGAGDAAESPQLPAKDKIALVDACESIDDLAQYESDETRKTVLAAIERRFRYLTEAEHLPSFGGMLS